MNKVNLIKDTLQIKKYDIDLESFKEEDLDHIIAFLEGIYKNTNTIESKKLDDMNFDSLTQFAEDILNKTTENFDDNKKDT